MTSRNARSDRGGKTITGSSRSVLAATGSDVLELIGDAVVSTDAGGSILFFNRAAEDIFSYEAEEVLGRSVEMLLPPRFSEEHVAHVRDFSAGQEGTQRVMGHRRQAVGQRKGGQEFPVEAVVSRRKIGGETILTVVVRDITERQTLEKAMAQQNASLKAQEARLRLALKGGRMGTWEWNAKTGEFSADARARSFFGIPEGAPFAIEDALDRIHEEDLPAVRRALDEAVELGRDYRREFRIVSPDGSCRWLAGKGAALDDGNGRHEQIAGVVFDVTDQKELEEQRRLLSRELAHRFKNMMAVVNSVVTLSGRNADSVEDYRSSLTSRLRSVARTQRLLGDSASNITLIEQLTDTFEPYQNPDGSNIVLEGPSVSLDPHTAVPMGLVLHELATNAAKYGALSTDAGRVEVRWSLVDQHGRNLLLVWKEIGGPAVSPPARKGFGSALIERSVRQSLSGNLLLKYAPEGFSCEITVPFEQANSEPELTS